MSNVKTTHPEPETLAAFAEGRLDGAPRASVVEHLAGCRQCMGDVSLAMTAAEEEQRADERQEDRGRPVLRGPWYRKTWLYAAAAAIVIALLVPFMRESSRRSPVESLVALAPRSARAVEPRLSGGFAWAPYHGPARAGADGVDAKQLKLGGAAGELVERAERDRSPEAQHAAGVAMVLVDKPAEALARLETAARAGNDARIWSDLAAARYSAAVSLGRTSLLSEALAATDAALRIDAKSAEALFNRALILEKLGLSDEARRAWERYLTVDATSEWAKEARARLAELPPSTRSSRFERDQPLLERAAADGDTPRVLALTGSYPQQARTFGEAEYLGRWAALHEQNDAEADRWLRIARGIGAALAATSGESLLQEAVRAIDGAAPAQRDVLAAAHLAYRRGRIAHSRHDEATAERELRNAAGLFATAASPMALLARYYAASARLGQNDTAGARAELEAIRADTDAQPRYRACGAHVRWELARTHILEDDWAGAATVLQQAGGMFHRGGERASESFVEAMHANALTALGRLDEAWSARVRAFTALSAEGHSDMLATAVTGALREEMRSGRNDAALALARLDVDSVRPVVAIAVLIDRALLESLAGNDPAALQSVLRAESMAWTIPDAALRERSLADAAVARGTADRDPRRAMAALTGAIDFYRRHELTLHLPEPLLLRARAAVRSGDPAAALQDLHAGIAALERHRAEAIGTGVLRAERALFTDAIALLLDRGDMAGAFACAERARGAAITLAAMQQRLAGTATVVLETVVLPGEVVTFAIAAHGTSVARKAPSASLHDQLVEPFEALLAGAERIIFVPDRSMENVAFAALYDTRRKQQLIERFEIAIAASGASLQRRKIEPLRTALALALPSDDLALPSDDLALPSNDMARLPETEAELADVAASYAHARRASRATLAELRNARADVVHVAGHTMREQGAGEQALVFADGRASWKSIATLAPLQARLVVLAACETLRRPEAAHTRALSLGAAFAAAGAHDVVGTLTPIHDREARVLFRALHRHIAAGATPAAAVRAAQLEGLRSGSRAWESVALLTATV
ncbi:MAG TPA: CHAT domain-containing protein [Thermoanaerobaculia bacterium]